MAQNHCSSLLFFEQAVKSRASFVGAARGDNIAAGQGRNRAAGSISGDGNTRLEKFALVGLIFGGNADWYWFCALEAFRRIEVGALLAAMQGCVALWAIPLKISPRRQRRRAIVTARSPDSFHQPRQTWSRHVDRQPWTGLARALLALSTLGFIPVTIHIAALSVFSIVIHAGSGSWV